MRYLLVGRITKSKGLDGEFKLRVFLSDTTKITPGILLKIGNEHGFQVASVSIKPGDSENIFVKLKGYTNIDSIKKIISKDVFLDVNSLSSISNDEKYLFQLVGYNVTIGKDNIGTISDIRNYGGKDIFIIENNLSNRSKEIMVPHIDDIIVYIDDNEKKIHLHEKKYKQVCVENEN